MTQVPGRECGECTACCQYIPIDDHGFKKAANEVCPNCELDKGCSIYGTRPDVCRGWYCGWWYVAQLDDSWRPDRSGVMVRVDGRNNVSFMIIGDGHFVSTPKFASAVAMFIEAGAATFLSIPGPKGYFPAQVQFNEQALPSVSAHDLPAFQKVLFEALVSFRNHVWEKHS